MSWIQRAVRSSLDLLDRVRLPAASTLPLAGAVVGVYSGLAAGIFANLLGVVSALFLLPAKVAPPAVGRLWTLAQSQDWNSEYAIVGAPLALLALWLSRQPPGGPGQTLTRQRLRMLGLLTLGGLALYCPLVALSFLNATYGNSHRLISALQAMPWWAMLLAPAVGGAVVGEWLRRVPEVRGHGVTEVIDAVRAEAGGMPIFHGLLKLAASAVSIGSGGSAGREGPIVYGGASVGASVGRTLGFTRKQLSVLLAAGAGAGIAASFDTPIAGAVFAMEIILREVELTAFSPLLLASVTATMVARGVMGAAPMLVRVPYKMTTGWEILGYALLGLVLGAAAFALLRLLWKAERFFGGEGRNRLSSWLGARPAWLKAAIGGLAVGAMALVAPSVWGTGHAFVNLALAKKLGLLTLLAALGLKIVATAITLGSGGSGGLFFPAAVIGAMGGGALGRVLHVLVPSLPDPAGAFAMVGIGGAVAAVLRGPLTGLIMIYELSGNSAIILPLMVTCTLASSVCHALNQRFVAPRPEPLTEGAL
jgi:CIC family chloride channel protein